MALARSWRRTLCCMAIVLVHAFACAPAVAQSEIPPEPSTVERVAKYFFVGTCGLGAGYLLASFYGGAAVLVGDGTQKALSNPLDLWNTPPKFMPGTLIFALGPSYGIHTVHAGDRYKSSPKVWWSTALGGVLGFAGSVALFELNEDVGSWSLLLLPTLGASVGHFLSFEY